MACDNWLTKPENDWKAFVATIDSMENDLTLRPLDTQDYDRLTEFLQGKVRIHRHLDWHPPIDWLGKEPFWVLEQKGVMQAVLAMPDDPPGAYWIRLFAVSSEMDDRSTWVKLFSQALEQVRQSPSAIIGALAYEEWFNQLLREEGWLEHQRVVLLKWHPQTIDYREPATPYLLRPMTNADLETVSQIDQVSFEPLWQQSLDATRRSYDQCSYCTVVECKDEVIAYQISTSASFNAHLARLAVLPEKRRLGIGSALVMDMLKYYRKPWIREVTVNTQQDNLDSLKLYGSIGFEKTGESFPIYVYGGNG